VSFCVQVDGAANKSITYLLTYFIVLHHFRSLYQRFYIIAYIGSLTVRRNRTPNSMNTLTLCSHWPCSLHRNSLGDNSSCKKNTTTAYTAAPRAPLTISRGAGSSGRIVYPRPPDSALRTNITVSANELMFYSAFVCSFVCLFVCLLATSRKSK